MLLRILLTLTTILSITPNPSSAYKTNTTHPQLSWILTPTNTTLQFRGLSPISASTAWISGTRGTVLRTTDSGKTWTNLTPQFLPGENATTFELRDIHAWSKNTAVVLSIGEGNASRIYRTSDAGKKWDLTFLNTEPRAFYDCLAFRDDGVGLAVSDPVNGKFRIISTHDGGRNWTLVPDTGMPPALEGEFAFAASGTCLTVDDGKWYLASGGVDPGRIFTSVDDGVTWNVAGTPVSGGEAGGVFSVRFRGKNGVIVGGDFQLPTANTNNAAWSEDRGNTWEKTEKFPGGYRSGVAWWKDDVAVAVGTSGSDVSFDGGRNWVGFDNGTFDAVECIKGACWASGARGRVARLDVKK